MEDSIELSNRHISAVHSVDDGTYHDDNDCLYNIFSEEVFTREKVGNNNIVSEEFSDDIELTNYTSSFWNRAFRLQRNKDSDLVRLDGTRPESLPHQIKWEWKIFSLHFYGMRLVQWFLPVPGPYHLGNRKTDRNKALEHWVNLGTTLSYHFLKHIHQSWWVDSKNAYYETSVHFFHISFSVAWYYLSRMLPNTGTTTNIFVRIGAAALHNFTMLLILYLIARYLNLEWRINLRWFPAVYNWVAVVWVLPAVFAMIAIKGTFKILVYIPALDTCHNYLLKNLFAQHKNNYGGMALTMVGTICVLECLRFLSFMVLWLDHKDGALNTDRVLNIICSIIGEIYSHTKVWQLIKNEMQMRFYGRRFDNFSELHSHIGSIRSVTEYFVPAIFTLNVLIQDLFSNDEGSSFGCIIRL